MVLAAVGQLCSKAVVETNMALCSSIIRRAASAGAKLVWLPEASDFIADAASVPKLARPLGDSAFLDGLKHAAVLGNIWVGVGVHESSSDPKRCYNTNVLITPEGEIASAYRKVHLFDVDIAGGATILESNTTIPGDALLPPAATPIGAVGLLTCYDLRFPEASLNLVKRGAQVLTYPYGNAMIVDPWGTVVAQASDYQDDTLGDDAGTFAMADIDLDFLEKIRLEMPLHAQRRPDVYSA
ncbi:hypothetical protein RQP46_011449 [Phenoliferia psychrophenolica]